MAIKLGVCFAAMGLVVLAVLYLGGGGRESAARGTGERAAVPTQVAPAPLVEDSAPTPAVAPAPAAREATPAVVDLVAPNAWRGELAALVGRVVESDHTPVAGIRVSLLEVDSSFLFDGSAIDADEPRLELEETVTDREGRFALAGARASAFHGLGVDLGGPRATIRVIDHELPHHERTDIGDVVLAPFGVVTGRIVDEGGAPVAGARVRFGPFPEQVLQASPQEFRADSLIAIGPMAMGGEGHGVIELPDWVRRAIDRFPVPTTQSAADGTFRLEGVALAKVIGGVDKRGYVGAPLGPLDLTGGTHDVGDVVLARGRTVRGVVEDSSGDPVVGAEVFAGAELFPGVAAILQPCGLSDDEGKFTLTGVATAGQIVASARRARHEAWSTTVSAQAENVLVELETVVQLALNVRDEQQKPLSGARIRLTPAPSDKRNGAGEVLFFLPKPASPPADFREVEPGRYVDAGLGIGTYDVAVYVPGLAPSFARAACLAGTNEVTLTCTAGSALELSVIDAVTRAPVAGARASVLRVGASGFSKIAAESTDAHGNARLGPLPDFAREPLVESPLPATTMLLVQHPRYGDHSAKLELAASQAVVPLAVELEAGGVLAGRVHWGGAVPQRVYMLAAEFRKQEEDEVLEMFHVPRFTVTDLAGEFRVANLVPGKYRVELSERFLDADPLGLMNDDFSAATLHSEEIEIKNGETTELVIDLTPTGRGPTAQLVGRVRVDGRNLAGAEVDVRGNEHVKVVSDASGRFETAPFSIQGSVWVMIEGDVPLEGESPRRMQLHQESLELQKDEVHEIELDLYPQKLHVQVVDSAGQPVPGAQVSARVQGEQDSWWSGDQQVKANDAGEAVLVVLKAGKYVMHASADGFAQGASEIEVSASGPTKSATIRMPRSVACAGRVLVPAPASDERGQRFAYIQVEGENGGGSDGTMLEAPDYAFTLTGLGEGKYRAWLYVGGEQGQEVHFELGPEGNRNLVLEFTPSVEDE